MKAKLGIVCMVLGAVLLAAALALFLSNDREQQAAAQAVDAVMPQLVEEIHRRHEEATAPAVMATEPEVQQQILAPQWPKKEEMPVVKIDGQKYIGFVGIPALGLELPVISEWSHSRLQIAPCRFMGDMYSDDLVIMAHNYDRHFGLLKDLRLGDTVSFTDMDGDTVYYTVVALDVLGPKDVEEMVAGEYDLTLFTCTYGGEKRVTVRCDRTKIG